MTMPRRRRRRPARATLAPRLATIVAIALALGACVGGAGASRVPVATAPSASLGAASHGPSPAPPSSPDSTLIADAALKEALLARFGNLAYCDPDFYPIARADEASAAAQHLDEMQADHEAWAAIAGRLGFDPSTTPTGDDLLRAYREWKMLRGLTLTPATDGRHFDAVFGQGLPGAAPSGPLVHVTGSIRADGSIVVESQSPGTMPPCPICLARGTRIATPAGEVAVETIRPGDPVWTLLADGRRVAVVVAEVGSTAVPPTHRVVALALADGRRVRVSPGHPLPDGRPVGAVRSGDPLDGSTVASAELVPYDGGRTFDLLPAGPTGIYWANGIELASTLAPPR
jgi:Hint domain